MSKWQGIEVADPSDSADVPAAMKAMVSSGMLPRFANMSAINSQISPKTDGVVVYRNDTKQIMILEHGAWKAINSWAYIDNKPDKFSPQSHADADHSVDYIKANGDRAMSADLNLGSNRIINVQSPASGAAGDNHIGDRAYNDTRYAMDNHNHDPADHSAAHDGRFVELSTGPNPQVLSNNLRVPKIWINSTQIWLSEEGSAGDELRIAVNNAEKVRITSTAVAPVTSGTYNLGGSSNRWGTVYATDVDTPSSASLKEDIEPWDFDALSAVRHVPVNRFRWRDTGEAGSGFVAEDMPDEIQRESDGPLAVSQNSIVAWLWQAVRQLAARVEELEAR